MYIQEIQNIPNYSDKGGKKFKKKISEKNPLTNKISWSPIKGSFP